MNSSPQVNDPSFPIASHDFSHGIEGRYHHPFVTYEFIHGNPEKNVKICPLPRFKSWQWKTRKITKSYTPILAILMNECTEYDYIVSTNKCASTIIFHLFHIPTNEFMDCGFPRFIRLPMNEFMGYGHVSMSFSMPTNEFVVWDINRSLPLAMNEFMASEN